MSGVRAFGWGLIYVRRNLWSHGYISLHGIAILVNDRVDQGATCCHDPTADSTIAPSV